MHFFFFCQQTLRGEGHGSHYSFFGNVTHLLLFILYGELEPAEVHSLSVLERGSGGVVIEQHLQLVRTPGVVQ